MLNISLMLIPISLLPTLLLLTNHLFSKKTHYSREKSSPFECGFDPLSNRRVPYSNQFFMISLMFLIFDTEITLLIPLIYLLKTLSKPMVLCSIFFLLILFFGTYLEYMEAAMDWKT